jgi:hypothetical protein
VVIPNEILISRKQITTDRVPASPGRWEMVVGHPTWLAYSINRAASVIVQKSTFLQRKNRKLKSQSN